MDNSHPGKRELSDPADGAFAITKDDTNLLAKVTAGIYVGTSGDLNVLMLSGETVIFKGIAAGVIHPIRCQKVMSTNTNAADIVGVY